ncbi:MAG: hypothetical protein M3R25_11480, partial [Bacteroidota bacterium]|nr:hypothetical protein [Bacteroidota bacterium]
MSQLWQARIPCSGSPFNLSCTYDGPGILLHQTFENGLGTWTTENLSSGSSPQNTAWTIQQHGYTYLGSPVVEFNSPGEGQFILSNADDGGGGTEVHTVLTSPPFSTIGYSSLILSFRHYYKYLSVETFIEVSTNGTNWTTLESYASDQGQSNDFNLVEIVLDSYADQSSLRIRFRYQG